MALRAERTSSPVMGGRDVWKEGVQGCPPCQSLVHSEVASASRLLKVCSRHWGARQGCELILRRGALRPFIEFASTAAELLGYPIVPGLLPLQSEGSEPAIKYNSVGYCRYSLSIK